MGGHFHTPDEHLPKKSAVTPAASLNAKTTQGDTQTTFLEGGTQFEPGATTPVTPFKEGVVDETCPLALTGKDIISGGPIPLTANGISQLGVGVVSDSIITKAWEEKVAPNETSVRSITGNQGELIAQLERLFSASGTLDGPRFKRFIITTYDDKIAGIDVEEVKLPEVTVTSAKPIRAKL